MQIYDEKGFGLIAEGLPSVPITADRLVRVLMDGAAQEKNAESLTTEQIFKNVTAAAEEMNNISHVFCKEDKPKEGLVLTSQQRLAATNMMFHLARHEYINAVKELVNCIGDDNRRLGYNEAVLFSILASAFENTMVYRKHRVPDMFAKTVNDLTLLRDGAVVSEEKLSSFVQEFNNRTEPLIVVDPFYEKTRDSLLRGLLILITEDGMLPKHEKTLADIETLMIKIGYPKEAPAILDALNAFINELPKEKAKEHLLDATSAPAYSLNLAWARLLADLRCIIVQYKS